MTLAAGWLIRHRKAVAGFTVAVVLLVLVVVGGLVSSLGALGAQAEAAAAAAPTGGPCPPSPGAPSGTLGHDPIGLPPTSSTIDLIINLAHGLGFNLTVTSTYRPGETSYHGLSQAVDFSDGTDTPTEMAFDRAWAAHYGAETAELIHAGGVNIKDGKDVGDGLLLYGAATMAEHHNHVHIALSTASILAGAGGGAVPAPAAPPVPLPPGAPNAARAAEALVAAQAAQQAGFPGDQLVTAVAVKLAESNGWTAVNSIGASGGWQILQSAHPEFAAQWADGSWQIPAVNAMMALRVWRGAGGWTPWTVFTGADTPGHRATYLDWVGTAQQAVAAIGGPVTAPVPCG